MNIELDLIQSLAVTGLLLVLGEVLRHRVGFLTRFCIPGPVIGGFLFSLLVLALRQSGGATILVDTSLQTPAMVAFFTTIGLGASFRLLKLGGRFLVVYLVACWTIAIFQNLVGVGLAQSLGINRLLGVMAGAVSLEGGHGAAAAFGPTAQDLGAQGASTVALAAATYGLLAGGLLGGPLAAWLIQRHRLPTTPREVDQELEGAGESATDLSSSADSLLRTLALIGVVMVLGMALGQGFTDATGFALPSYVGAMIVAVIVRNLNDKFGWFENRPNDLSLISTLTLGFFLTQAMMTLKIWELYALAIPLMTILLVQTVVLLAFVSQIVFRLLGRNYDAAIMCAGMMGHGLGGTPNAMANMDAVGQRFGAQSKLALLIVPLSGAVLIDTVALPWIVFCLNVFK